jgi:hypothetical protein
MPGDRGRTFAFDDVAVARGIGIATAEIAAG